MTGKKSVDILRRVFRYENFRGKQEETIDSICQSQNTVLVMPTGGGKSICYAVPVLMQQKIVVVVFPLLALLLDQVERMKSKGLNVCFLMNDMDDTERQIVIYKLHFNPPEYNCLFLTPETVLSSSVFGLISKLSADNLINFFVMTRLIVWTLGAFILDQVTLSYGGLAHWVAQMSLYSQSITVQKLKML